MCFPSRTFEKGRNNMKTKVGMAAVAAVLISGYASAWTSTFFDRTHGGSFTYADATSPEDAQHYALQVLPQDGH